MTIPTQGWIAQAAQAAQAAQRSGLHNLQNSFGALSGLSGLHNLFVNVNTSAQKAPSIPQTQTFHQRLRAEIEEWLPKLT